MLSEVTSERSYTKYYEFASGEVPCRICCHHDSTRSCADRSLQMWQSVLALLTCETNRFRA